MRGLRRSNPRGKLVVVVKVAPIDQTEAVTLIELVRTAVSERSDSHWQAKVLSQTDDMYECAPSDTPGLKFRKHVQMS
jgi:hypothetical protein